MILTIPRHASRVVKIVNHASHCGAQSRITLIIWVPSRITGNPFATLYEQFLIHFIKAMEMRARESVKYSFQCGLRGFHVYKEVWSPIVGEVLRCIFIVVAVRSDVNIFSFDQLCLNGANFLYCEILPPISCYFSLFESRFPLNSR